MTLRSLLPINHGQCGLSDALGRRDSKKPHPSWEQLKLPYVVVAQLSQPIQKLIKGDLIWTATEVPGTEVAQLEYQAMSWPHPRRLVLLRHCFSNQEERDRWPLFWEKILSPFPNCNAVENQPTFTA